MVCDTNRNYHTHRQFLSKSSQTVSGFVDDVVFLPVDKHMGSSQYDVYSFDGMAGD